LCRVERIKRILKHQVLATQNFDYFVGVAVLGPWLVEQNEVTKQKVKLAKIRAALPVRAQPNFCTYQDDF
jgi:hypothetical protein